LCTLLGAAGSVVGLSVASAQTMFSGAPFGEHASLRLTKAPLRAQEASPDARRKARFERVSLFPGLARPFAARTCYEFRDMRWRLAVAVHDDARVSRGFPLSDIGLVTSSRPVFTDSPKHGAS
jgi:hypothetical protein